LKRKWSGPVRSSAPSAGNGRARRPVNSHKAEFKITITPRYLGSEIEAFNGGKKAIPISTMATLFPHDALVGAAVTSIGLQSVKSGSLE
jgi:hypothetical protein